MWSHLTFNLLRYKLLHPFYRRRIRRWEGKKLALDLTFGTCSGQNSSTTIFTPSRLPLHHRSCGNKSFPLRGPTINQLPTLAKRTSRRRVKARSTNPSHGGISPLALLSVCMITPSSPCFRAGPLTRLAFSEVYQASLCSLAEQHLKESPWFPLESPGKQRSSTLSWAALEIIFLILRVELFIWRSKVSGNIKATGQKKILL